MYNNFFSKIVPFCDNVSKYGTARRAAYDSMAHEYCMLDT